MNLKHKKKEPWLNDKHIKFIAVYFALALVLIINQAVFSYLLKDRERAGAFSSAFGTNFFSYPAGFTGANIQAGTNMQLLADLWLSNGWTNDNLTCSYQLGGACFPMADADGAFSPGAGTDDDGAAGSPFNLVPYGGNYAGIFFSWTQWVCADSCANPTQVYYDDTANFLGGPPIIGDCIPGNTPGATDVPILGVIGAGPFTNVGFGTGMCGWIHSELVNNNGLWDYCDPAVTPACGANAAAAEAATETAWAFNLKEDTVLAQGSDWNNPVLGQWQGSAFAAFVGNERFVDLDATTVGGFDGIATEPAIIDLDGDNVYASAADILVVDQSDAIPLAGATLYDVAAADNVCSDNTDLAIATCVYIDTGGVCGDGTEDTHLLGGAGCDNAGDVLIVTGDNWAKTDNIIDATTDIYKENVAESLTYSAEPDTDVYSTGLASTGDALIVGNGPNGQPLHYLDADLSGTLTATDTIVEDNGNVQTGPGGVPNNVLDRADDYIQMFMVSNAGSALPGTDISNLYFCSPGADNWCGTGDAGEACSAPIPYQSAVSAWFDPAMSSIPIGIGKICIFADISAGATAGRTIQLQVPQLIDNGNGLYDAGLGEKGIFNFSNNDGPTGAPAIAPYVLTILSLPSYGSTSPDTMPPSNVTNASVTADSSGTAVITWIDPIDSDLSQIIIDVTIGGQTTTNIVNPGVQTLTLAGLQVGGAYTFSLRAGDRSGNNSVPVVFRVTIPAQGQIIVVPEIPVSILPLPSPEITLPAGINVGDLLKNATRTTVYIVGNDKKRHVFPNESTYFTWFPDFSMIKAISDDILSQIPLNSNVTARPGAKLIKIQTDPKVYAVEPGGIIRPIASAEIAASLYGYNWASRVIDIADPFFINYTLGSAISEAIYPTGSLIQYRNSSDIYYVENNKKRLVASAVFTYNEFKNEFVNRSVSTSMIFETGDNLPQMTIIDQMR